MLSLTIMANEITILHSLVDTVQQLTLVSYDVGFLAVQTSEIIVMYY